MRRLLLLRHAKSSWEQSGLDDMSRPLAARGRSAAPLIGRHISGYGLIPDLVVCSSAERARQTLELVHAEWDDGVDEKTPRVEMRAALYLAAPSDMLAMLRRLDDGIKTVMLVGHNPGMGMLAMRLAAKGDPRGMKTMARNFPTAALAVLDLEIASWRALDPGCGYLQSFIRPKDLT